MLASGHNGSLVSRIRNLHQVSRNFKSTTPAGFVRNNPETKFYSPEKLPKKINGICDGVAVRSSAAELALRDFTDKPMQRFSISLMGALLGMSLVTAAVEDSNAKAVITRSELCSNLSHQFDEALETHATATQVTAAKALQRKGNRFCANKKQAQGIRMLANALKLLGVTPIDPVQ